MPGMACLPTPPGSILVPEHSLGSHISRPLQGPFALPDDSPHTSFCA